MKSTASTPNICNLGVVVPLFISIGASLGFNQTVRDCSMQRRFVIEPSDIYRHIGGMESKIECMVTCLRELGCSGVQYENKTESCNFYRGAQMFRRGLEGNYAMYCEDLLRGNALTHSVLRLFYW